MRTHQVDDDPGCGEAEEHPPLDPSPVRNRLRDVERRAVPEVLRLRRHLALGHETHDSGGAVAVRHYDGVVHCWAIRPGKCGLQWDIWRLFSFLLKYPSLQGEPDSGIAKISQPNQGPRPASSPCSTVINKKWHPLKTARALTEQVLIR